MFGDDEFGQNVNLSNITGAQKSNREIFFVLGKNGMGLDMHTIKVDI